MRLLLRKVADDLDALTPAMLDATPDKQRFALSALLEVTPPATVGSCRCDRRGDYVVTYRFATTFRYPGWN